MSRKRAVSGKAAAVFKCSECGHTQFVEIRFAGERYLVCLNCHKLHGPLPQPPAPESQPERPEERAR
jgi:hypothetical protein